MPPGFSDTQEPNPSTDLSSSQPCPSLPMAIPPEAPAQHAFECPTSIQSPAVHTARTPLAWNSFSNLQCPMTFQPPSFSANQSPDAGACSSTQAANVELENPALHTTATTFIPLMSSIHYTEHVPSSQSSELGSRRHIGFHDKVTTVQVPSYMHAKSKIEGDRELTGGWRHRSSHSGG
jgi:hypothetical protein